MTEIDPRFTEVRRLFWRHLERRLRGLHPCTCSQEPHAPDCLSTRAAGLIFELRDDWRNPSAALERARSRGVL